MSAPYVTGLRTELVRAVGAQRERRVARQRRLVTLSAAAAALLLVFGGFAVLDGGVRPALAIAADGNTVTVSLVDAAADPAAMTAQLAEAGVDAVVLAQPVPAELAGRWVSGTGRITELTARRATLARDASGVVLRIGVASTVPSVYAGSAFAPGGLLACSALQGASAAHVHAELTRLELPHMWRSIDGEPLDAAPNRAVVVDATLSSNGTLVLATAPAPSRPSTAGARCE